MELNQDAPLFGLSIDPVSKNHLAEAARWARFLAIVGFIVCGIIVIVGIFFGSFFSTMDSRYSRYEGNDVDISSITAVTAAIAYTVVAVLCFFPYLFLYRFASRMKAALLSDDQETLNRSFQNLKKMFRFVGILTIIGLAFYAIGLVAVLAGVGASRL